MWAEAGWFLVGLIALLVGAEWLVRSAAALAAALGVSSLVVGLTMVAFGTSAPELVVSVVASARGEGALATGNVVGSNIANVALILGLAALIRSLEVGRGVVARDVPIMIGVTLLVAALGLGGEITRLTGGILLAVFAAYVAHIVQVGRVGAGARQPGSGIGQHLARAAAGAAGLGLGAHLLVESSTAIARGLGVSETLIGLTLLALGTSVPELAASGLAAYRRNAEIVFGNIVGSNIFNLTLVMGAASLVAPLPVDPALYAREILVMIGVAILVLPLMWTRLTLHRWEGVLLLSAYGGFVWWVFQ